MPPRKRAEPAPEAQVLDETPKIEQPEPKPHKPAQERPCPLCFPDGWPQGATAVGCEHGHWAREVTR